MTNNEEEEISIFNDLNPNISLNSEHLYNRWKSIESSYQNMPQKIWNAMSDYYRSQGLSGVNELENIKKKRIQNDFNQKKEDYQKAMSRLYDDYYNKLTILFNMKNINNKQSEIINNTQYKILQQRDVEKNMTDDISTKNRLKMYYDKKFRNTNNSIHNYIYLSIVVIVLMIIIFAINSSSLDDTQGNIIQSIFSDTNQKISGIYMILVLLITIILQSYNLTIMVLIIYSFMVILSSENAPSKNE